MKKLAVAFLLSLCFINPTFARTDINQYWSIEADYNGRNCNIFTNYGSQKLIFFAKNKSVSIVLYDPNLTNINNGDYKTRFTFSSRNPLIGVGSVDGLSFIISDLTVQSVINLSYSEWFKIEFGTYAETFSLRGSNQAINELLSCAINSRF